MKDRRSLKNVINLPFLELKQRTYGIHLTDIRSDRLIYALAYAFELILYSTRELFLPMQVALFGLPGNTVVYIGHMFGSLLIMLLWSERFRHLIRISVAVTLAGFVPLLFLPEGIARLLFGLLAMTGLGGAVTCARCGFAFAANNAERLLGMFFASFGVAGVMLLDALQIRKWFAALLLPALLLAFLSGCLLRFRESDLEVKPESNKADAKGLYWALVLMMAYMGMDGYIFGLIDMQNRMGCLLFIVGFLVAVCFLFVTFVWLRINVWHLWTLFFVFSTTMAILAIAAPQPGSALPLHFFCGLANLGWPLSLYVLACAQRRFASYRLLKRCTVIFILLSPLTTLSSGFVQTHWPERFPVAVLIYVLAVLFLFLLSLPYSYRHLFSAVWVSEIHRSDMDLLREKVTEADRFAGYGLTPRQREVAVLLLAAKTRRQISGELKLSESTVKMHTSDLYRKLGINSRVELFRLFGVAEDAKEE